MRSSSHGSSPPPAALRSARLHRGDALRVRGRHASARRGGRRRLGRRRARLHPARRGRRRRGRFGRHAGRRLGRHGRRVQRHIGGRPGHLRGALRVVPRRDRRRRDRPGADRLEPRPLRPRERDRRAHAADRPDPLRGRVRRAAGRRDPLLGRAERLRERTARRRRADHPPAHPLGVLRHDPRPARRALHLG